MYNPFSPTPSLQSRSCQIQTRIQTRRQYMEVRREQVIWEVSEEALKAVNQLYKRTSGLSLD